jgi:hypothetical protein
MLFNKINYMIYAYKQSYEGFEYVYRPLVLRVFSDGIVALSNISWITLNIDLLILALRLEENILILLCLDGDMNFILDLSMHFIFMQLVSVNHDRQAN